MNHRLCFGNWKLNKTPKEVDEFIFEFSDLVKDDERRNFCVFPSPVLSQSFSVSKELPWGGQNCYFKTQGAYTGETSASVLKEMGASYCLIGHSERRQIFLETDDALNLKVKCALSEGLTPVFCIGETEEEKDKGETLKVLEEQISKGLKGVELSKVIIAYEPVWAIGTGKAASPEISGEVHDKIRQLIKNNKTPLLYGGSVKPNNAKALFKNVNINGFLVGGASLKAAEFYQIYSEMETV